MSLQLAARKTDRLPDGKRACEPLRETIAKVAQDIKDGIDGYIRTNPTEGVLKEIKKSHNWEKPKRHALTEAQQRRFISYVARSKVYSHWLPLFTVLLGTGGRISEILDLRWVSCAYMGIVHY